MSAQEDPIGRLAAFLDRTLPERAAPRPAPAPVEPALRLLTEASAALAASRDFDQTLQAAARLAVPGLAEWCRLDLVDRHGRAETGAVAAADPAREALLREWQSRTPLEPGSPQPAARALRSGQPLLIDGLAGAQLAAGWPAAEAAALLGRIGVGSLIAAPLAARGRALGALTLARGPAGRPYDRRDLRLAAELARLAAMALDGARLHRELERALAARDEFLSHAAHDLKNPLTTARAQSQLLRSWALRDEPPALERILHGFDRLDASVTKMARLIDELRDAATLELGRPLALRLEEIDLVALARQSVAEYQLATRRHQVRLETELDALVGSWDSGRLDRVLANLLDNALKYSPNGGEIVVAVGREPAEAGGRAVLSVRDQGIGIPASDQPRVFDHHHRAANVVRRSIGGGIGLAGVRAIVSQHGGRVELESQEGAGSTLTLRLPLAVRAERPVEDDRNGEAPDPARRALDRRDDLG